jgi:hypothetical protein
MEVAGLVVPEVLVESEHDSMLLRRASSQPGQASKRYRILQAKCPQ